MNKQQIVENVSFYQYSGCALSYNSTDQPYITITSNYFYGLNTTNSMGLCIAGQGPSLIQNNSFENNRVHLKLGTGGVGIKVTANDFVEFSDETPASSYTRAAIWVVPNTSSANGSIGLTISNNKFGNEHLDTEDVRLLFADDNTSGGSYFGDTLWKTTASTRYINGLIFDGNLVNGGASGTGSGVNPIIYSYTPNIRSSKVSANFKGTAPGYVLQFDSSVSAANDYTSQSNEFGPFLVDGYPSSVTTTVSNIAGYGITTDPTGNLGYNDPSVITPFTSGAGLAGYANLLNTSITAFNSSIGGGSKTTITDASGGTNAVTYTSNGTASFELYSALNSTPTLGAQNWIEVDLRQGSTGTSMSSVNVSIADAFSNPQLTQKKIVLSSTWHRYKIPFVLRSVPTHSPPIIEIWGSTGTTSNETVDIGQVRVYTATEPASGGLFLTPVYAPSIMVGTTSPASTFELQGVSGTNPFDVASSTGSSIFRILQNGNVGIGTTTPWRTLSVTGTVGFDGLTANFGSGSLCLTANKEVVYNSGSDSCLSSLRSTKHEISPLSIDAFSQLAALQPVSFIYNNDASSTVRYGFIAEDTAAVDPHLATYGADGSISGVDDRGLLAVLVSAVQGLMSRVGNFADSFTTRELTFTRATGDELTVKNLHAQQADIQQLCAKKSDGTDVCVTGDQLATMFAAVGASTNPASADSSAPDTTPPTVTINSDNPAHIHVGDSYADLGAGVTDNVDHNLGLKYFLNGALASNIVIDTSTAATDTIDYVATDNAGNTATSTRTVIISSAAQADAATTTTQ